MPDGSTVDEHRRRRVPRAAPAARPTTSCRCRAAPPSSTPRTPARSSRWPTSSPAPSSSRPASAPARCRCRCCARWGRPGTCTPSSGARTSPRSRGPTPATTSAADHPAWTVTVGDLVEALPRDRRRRHRRPGRPRHARPVGVPRGRRRRPRARRRAHLLRRHRHPAVQGRRGDARPRHLHRAAGLGVARARLAPRGARRPTRSTGCTATPASSSPPGASPRASRRRCASAVPGKGYVTGEEATEQDWTPEAIGERVPSEKRVRKVRRSVTDTDR